MRYSDEIQKAIGMIERTFGENSAEVSGMLYALIDQCLLDENCTIKTIVQTMPNDTK